MVFSYWKIAKWELNNGWEVTMDPGAVGKMIFPSGQFRLGKWQSLKELDEYSCSGDGAVFLKAIQSKCEDMWRSNAEMANIWY